MSSKISALTDGTTANATDRLPVSRAGANRYITPAYLLAYIQSNIAVPLANGGTGASLSDPNADRILFWDDSAGGVTWLTAGTGLTITGTTLSTSSSGIGDRAQAFRASQTISDSTQTNMAFSGTDVFDTNTMHDTVTNNSRVTIQTTGLYLVDFKGDFAVDGGVTGYRWAQLRKNASSTLQDVYVPVVSGNKTSIHLAGFYLLSATDYVEVRVYQSSGGSLTIDDNYFTVIQLA